MSQSLVHSIYLSQFGHVMVWVCERTSDLGFRWWLKAAAHSSRYQESGCELELCRGVDQDVSAVLQAKTIYYSAIVVHP